MGAANKKDRNEQILLKKVNTDPEDLCRGFPQELLQYYQVCQKLQYSEQPSYSDLYNIVRGGLDRRQMPYDCVFDWCGATENDEGSTQAESDPLSSRSREKPAGSREIVAREIAGQLLGSTDLKRKASDHQSAPQLEGPLEKRKHSKIEST